jgi:5-methylcytosine-specific restriction enzyme A
MLVRLCPRCGVRIPQYPHTRGPCQECRRTHERERSRKRRAESAAAKTRGSRTWQQIREIAKRRDGYRCRHCGSTEKIEAHHVQGLAEGGSAFSLENIITLCPDCHRKEGAKARGVFLSSAVPPVILARRERKSGGVPRTEKEIPSIG